MRCSPLPFDPADEVVDSSEPETFRRIAEVMDLGQQHARDPDLAHGRRSHAECTGALEGELRVGTDLPAELAQGLFARPRRYRALARLSHLPAEILDNRKVSSVRGLAVRIFDVPGVPIEREGEPVQDFVLDTGTTFNLAGPKPLIAAMGVVEATGPLPQGFKAAVSHAARTANDGLKRAGLGSLNLDILGHARRHPLQEAYYSQAPIRWGAFVAKIKLAPKNLPDDLEFDKHDPDGLRHAVQAWCSDDELRFSLSAQLRVDAVEMPIEDAAKEWPEALSAYRDVAELVFPPQDALDPSRQEQVDTLAFSPWYAVEDHRPLGGIMRARRYVYSALAKKRLAESRRASAPAAS